MGSSNTVLASSEQPHFLREPTVIEMISGTPGGNAGAPAQVYAVGRSVFEARPPPRRATQRIAPVERGEVLHTEPLVHLLRTLKQRTAGSWIERMVSSTVGAVVVSPRLEEAERTQLRSVLREVGFRRFLMVDAPSAAARGVPIDIEAAHGRMILDFGGGKTTLAGFSLGGSVSWHQIPFGGQDLDQAIARYVNRKFGMTIDPYAAEEVKTTLGSIFPLAEPRTMEVTGADPRGGIDKSVTLRDSEIRDVLVDACEPLIMGIQKGFESMPPELAGDILSDGMTIIGGGGLLWGFPEFLHERTGIPSILAEQPMDATIRGAQAILREALSTRGWRRRLEI